jgi:hypothetical protein
MKRAENIRAALNPASKDAFLVAAQTFPPEDGCTFDEYQRLAFKTARTDGRTLLEVCLAVSVATRHRTDAWQLSPRSN